MLLAVLQAVAIYSIILLSPSDTSPSPAPDDHFVFRKVEALVYHVARMGLFLDEERAQTRPSWADWIYVTSKRRAVLALYLLHWAYSVLHNVPCFDCRDLGFMPAPAPKVLWQASNEQEWNTKYIHWLSRWSGQIYLQAELGKISPGATMNSRAERWLGETDEFGYIMASIGNFLPGLVHYVTLTILQSTLQIIHHRLSRYYDNELLSFYCCSRHLSV